MVGYDTRFNSRPVAHLAADILAANGWRVLLADRPVPTPVVSYSVIAREEGNRAMDDSPVRNFYAEWRRRVGRASHDIDARAAEAAA